MKVNNTHKKQSNLKIPAKGKICRQSVDTTVDSEIARYYLENYLSNNKQTPELDDIIDTVETQLAKNFPDSQTLQDLTTHFSVDFATMYLVKRLLEDSRNSEFQNRFDDVLQNVKTSSKLEKHLSHPQFSSYMFLWVPAWDYIKSGPKMGTDYAKPQQVMEKLGLENHLVKIEPTGCVDKNAEIVARDILYYTEKSHKKIILVSSSSASPSVAHAIGEKLQPQQLCNVKGWVNCNGILRGAAFLEGYRSWHRRWILWLVSLLLGWKIKNIESMSLAVRRDKFQKVNIPQHILVLNYIGVPCSGDISKLAAHHYQMILHGGPNDGSGYILEAMVPNAPTIVSLGIDHFLNFDPDIILKTTTLGWCIVDYLENKNSED